MMVFAFNRYCSFKDLANADARLVTNAGKSSA